MELTPVLGLKKPTSYDNADLRIFVGDNMDLIETAIGTKISSTDADAKYSLIGHGHGWDEITGKPLTFVPVLASSTNVGGARVGNGLGMSGEYLYIKTGDGLLIDVNYALAIDKTFLDTLYSPIGHGHAISDITNLQNELNSKIGAGTILTDPIKFDINISGNSALIIECENYDAFVFRVGSDQDEYGYDLQYLGTGSGNDNILRLRSHNLTINDTPAEINIVDFFQNGTTKFYETMLIETDASHLKLRDSVNAKEWHFETKNSELRIVETNVIERVIMTDTIFRLRSKLSSHLSLEADTDNVDENDTAMIIMSQDNGTTRLEFGLDTTNQAFIRPYNYYNVSGTTVQDFFWRDASGGNHAFHHNGRTESIKTPTFQNGWGNYGGIYRDACYWKSQDGMVVIEGLVVGGTTSAYCFTLPVGYRPSEYLIFTTFSYLGACRVDVHTNGGVYMNTQTHASFTSLSGICFKAEQ